MNLRAVGRNVVLHRTAVSAADEFSGLYSQPLLVDWTFNTENYSLGLAIALADELWTAVQVPQRR